MICQNTKIEFLSFHKNSLLISKQTLENIGIFLLNISDKENENSFDMKMFFIRNDLFWG